MGANSKQELCSYKIVAYVRVLHLNVTIVAKIRLLVALRLSDQSGITNISQGICCAI